MEDDSLYRGRFDQVGDRKFNSVRVFVSSTFTGESFDKQILKYRIFASLDTTNERNGLIESVYPRLREYCVSKYNIQFQVIPLLTFTFVSSSP